MFWNRTEELKKSNELLKKEVSLLIEELKARKSVVDFLDEDLKELTGQERENYMTNVTVFYNNIFKKKLYVMIKDQKEALAQVGLSERMSDIYRSNINCLNLINDWFNRCQVEHLGKLQDDREEESINRLKKETYA